MKKLNIEAAKQIPMYEVMEKLGFAFQKEKGNNRWYLSPFRNEKTPSFKVNQSINKFYDFGTEESGDVINLIQKLKGFSTADALEYLSLLNISPFSFGKQGIKVAESSKQTFITTELSDPSLISYITSERGISLNNAKPHCSEILIDGTYKYIGFMNDNGGFALRNTYHKRAISPVGITSNLTGGSAVKIFEGFMDFLSLKEIIKSPRAFDFIVLNSLSNLKQVLPLLNKFNIVESYLDNDEAGKKATKEIINHHTKVIDYSTFFMKDTDMNFFHLYGKTSDKQQFEIKHHPTKGLNNSLTIT